MSNQKFNVESKTRSVNMAKEYDKNDMDMYNSPILVSDATSMFRRKVGPNMPPYVSTVFRKNNQKVDKWEKEMLNELCTNDNKLPSGRVLPLATLFEEGSSYPAFKRAFPHIPRPTEEQLEYWKSFLDRPIDELYDEGHELCLLAWQIVCNELKIRDNIKKYEAVYEKSSDPADWYDYSVESKHLFDGTEHAFWDEEKIKDISERVKTVVSMRMSPSSK